MKPTVTVTVTTDDDLVEGGAEAPVPLATAEPVLAAVRLTAGIFGCGGLSCWLWHEGCWLPSKGRLSETHVREGATLELRRRTDICHIPPVPAEGWETDPGLPGPAPKARIVVDPGGAGDRRRGLA